MCKKIFVKSCFLSGALILSFFCSTFSMNSCGKRGAGRCDGSGSPNKRLAVVDLGDLSVLPQEKCLYGIFDYLGGYKPLVPMSILKNASGLCKFALTNSLAHSLVLNYIEIHIVDRLIADNPNIANPNVDKIRPTDLIAAGVALKIIESIQRARSKRPSKIIKGSFLKYVLQSNPEVDFCRAQFNTIGAFWKRHVGCYVDRSERMTISSDPTLSLYNGINIWSEDCHSMARVALCLLKGANCMRVSWDVGFRFLLNCVGNKKIGFVELLLAAGADVNEVSPAGQTAMGLAAGNADMVALLRQFGAR